MRESSVYEHFLQKAEANYQRGFQQGIEQGARQTVLEFLFVVLEFRFDGRAVKALRPAIESIQNLQCLQELYSEALRAETFEAFVCTLSTNGNW